MEALNRIETMLGARRTKRAESKLGDVAHENHRLRLENESLRDQLHHEREELSSVLDILRSGVEPRRPRASRLRRIVVLGMAVGGAYVASTATGRDLIDRIRRRWGQSGQADRAERIDDSVMVRSSGWTREGVRASD